MKVLVTQKLLSVCAGLAVISAASMAEVAHARVDRMVAALEALAPMDGTVGNGGDVVVCRDGSGAIASVELLDFYEARVIRGFTIDLGAPTLPVAQKVQTAIGRMSGLAPLKTKQLLSWAADFEKEAIRLADVTLIDVPDSAHIVVPNNCRIEQIAIQRDPEFDTDKRYTINKDIWDRLDADNQAGLIIHEVLYREFKKLKSNSMSTRYWNAVLSGKELTMPQTDEAHFVLFDKLGIQDLERNGLIFKVYPNIPTELEKYFWPNGNLKRATLFPRPGVSVRFGAFTLPHDATLGFRLDGSLYRYEYGEGRANPPPITIPAQVIGPVHFPSRGHKLIAFTLDEQDALIGIDTWGGEVAGYFTLPSNGVLDTKRVLKLADDSFEVNVFLEFGGLAFIQGSMGPGYMEVTLVLSGSEVSTGEQKFSLNLSRQSDRCEGKYFKLKAQNGLELQSFVTVSGCQLKDSAGNLQTVPPEARVYVNAAGFMTKYEPL